MTFSIPEVDQLGWGQPLKDHLAQLNDPDTGGLCIVQNIEERNNKYWSDHNSTKNAYKNKTIYVSQLDSFQVWEVDELNNTYKWKTLSRNLSSDSMEGAGILSVTIEILGELNHRYVASNSSNNLQTLVKIGDILTCDGIEYIVVGIEGIKVIVGLKKWRDTDPISNPGFSGTFTQLSKSFSINVPNALVPGDQLFIRANGINSIIVNKQISPTQYEADRPYSQFWPGGTYEAYQLYKISRPGPYTIKYAPFIVKTTDEYNNLSIDSSGSFQVITHGSWILDQYSVQDNNKSSYSGLKTTSRGYQGVVAFHKNDPFLGYYPLYNIGLYRGLGSDITQLEKDKDSSLWTGDSELVGLNLTVGHTSTASNLTTNVMKALEFRGGIAAGRAENYFYMHIYPLTGSVSKTSPSSLWGIYENGVSVGFSNQVRARNFFQGNTQIGNNQNLGPANTPSATYSAISEKLMVYGNIVASGTITQGSDIRWKDNIESINNPLELLNQLNGVTYFWNKEQQECKDPNIHIGLIAQDAVNIPGAVKEDNDGYLHLDYMGLVGLLVEVCKNLNQRLNIIESKV